MVESFTAALAKSLKNDPPKRKGERTRERFKLATAQVLENGGFHAMRVSDITDAADASEGTFRLSRLAEIPDPEPAVRARCE